MNDSYAQKIKHLCDLVETNGLPDSARETLSAHLDQLDRPMSVAVFGADCIRVASVVNFLVGKRVLPDEGRPGIPIRVQHAETPVVQAKLTDGETKRYELEELSSVLDAARHVTIGAPLPALRKISIIQYVHEDMKKLYMAAKKSEATTDLTFLCADGFGPEEERFWMSLPEASRDRGYLLSPASAEVPNRARQVLAGVILADVEAAMKLREASGELDRAAFKETGGKELVSTIRREIEWSEQAVFDAATVLIHRAMNPKLTPKDAVSPSKPRSEEVGDQAEDDAPVARLERVASEPAPSPTRDGQADAMPSDAIELGSVKPRPDDADGAEYPTRNGMDTEIEPRARDMAR